VLDAGRTTTIALAIVGLTGLAACAEGPGPNEVATPAEAVVVIDDLAFDPQTLTVVAGTEVTFINEDDVRHSVVADDPDRALDSTLLDPDIGLLVHVFNTPGEVSYHCSVHPEMAGMIEVIE
jgi:plastocyanin